MSKRIIRLGRWSLEFKPEDCWIGAFWKVDSYETWHRPGIDTMALPAIGYSFDLWICIVPMLPIHYEKHWR